MSATLEVIGLGMQFEGLAALSDVTFEVPAGQVHGLIGPNGAGKTTLFNCITGFYKPTSGEVVLGGTRLAGRPPHEISALGISRTFQNIRLFASMTAIENVLTVWREPGHEVQVMAEPAKNRWSRIVKTAPGVPRIALRAGAEVAEAIIRTPRVRAHERSAIAGSRGLLRLVGLAGKENVVARNLSYGDQRRLELARALGTQPRVLLLDEPTAGMNPQESLAMVALIRRLRDERGVTIILIEHQMRVVMGVCEYITVLDYGRTIAEGTPAEIQRNPAVIEAYLGRRHQAGA